MSDCVRYARMKAMALDDIRYRKAKVSGSRRSARGECFICLDDAPPGKDRCVSCAEWEEYWNSLSREDKEREQHWMAEHSSMSDES